MKPNVMLSQSFLKECFTYYKDGSLVWNVRPACHFQTTRGYKIFLTKFAGKPVGSVNSAGYLQTRLTYLTKTIFLKVAHIVWVIHNGDIPEPYWVDHKDTNRSNNQFGNLRLALPANNAHNRNINVNNISGVKGVNWYKRANCWQARVVVNSKRILIGYFTTIEEATTAIKVARLKLHNEFTNHGELQCVRY